MVGLVKRFYEEQVLRGAFSSKRDNVMSNGRTGRLEVMMVNDEWCKYYFSVRNL